jgi:hypothetical protein
MAFRRSTGLRNKLLGKEINILSNPTFDSGTSGWSTSNAAIASVAGGYSNNAVEITNSSTVKGQLYQIVNVKVGREYKFDGYIKAGTSSVRLMIGTPTTPDLYYDSGVYSDNANWGHQVFYFEATDSQVQITVQLESTTSGDNGYADEMYLYDEASSIKEIFKNGKIKIYSGTQPASANDAPTGTLLVTITVNGTSQGISFNEASNGSISKNPTEVWSGTAVASGTAGWFRLQTYGDTESLSEADERIDGAIATSGAELNMSNTYISAGAVQTISVFDITINP